MIEMDKPTIGKVATKSKRGGARRNGGRKKGVPNKVTTDVREAIALIAQRNISSFESWLHTVAETNPAKAAELLLTVIEYHVPKLARTEITGKDGGAVQINLVNYGTLADTP